MVENDPTARATFDSLLGTRWAVTLADRGDEARDRAQATTFDLVIANVEIPGISGIDLARTLRANRATQDVPFILVSRDRAGHARRSPAWKRALTTSWSSPSRSASC